ncbi:MAG: UvrD-helicase domain-containing protein [Thermoanaerobaculia bacterium]
MLQLAALAENLNQQQFEAVTHGEGPQLVLAGAGSGKTRVITYRVAWLIHEQQVDPASIVAVTFTNKAAAEMKSRIEGLVEIYPLPTFVGTFHRFALDLLRRHGDLVGISRQFVIFDRDDQISAVKKALAAEGLAETAFPPRSVLGAISSAKNRLLDPEMFEQQANSFFEKKVASVYRQYQSLLVRAAGLDFDDMLRFAVKLLEGQEELQASWRSRIRYLLVDEFQDTNHAQMRMVLSLVGQDGNLTAVGDEDQGIYRWRGADLDNVLDFERTFPGAEVRKLERNYRSSQKILDAASGLVEHNVKRRAKTLWTDAGEGEPVELFRARDELDEAQWVLKTFSRLNDQFAWNEMGILVRTNAQTRAFEEELLTRKIPYDLVGGTRFYERAEVKDLVAYLRLLRNPRDNFSFLRVLNKPARGIGKATQQLLYAAAEEFGGCLWEALCNAQYESFPRRGAKALGEFRQLVEKLRKSVDELPLPALLDQLLEETGYAEIYKKQDVESQGRLENIREFLTAAQEFTERAIGGDRQDSLTAFLDHASLISDIDSWDEEKGVVLMTLHSAKGLEFEIVVIAGLEDGLLPHFNVGGAKDDIEEERRLLYVGMTRAKQRLILTSCRRRRIAGRYQDQSDSQFLAELPKSTIEVHRSPELFYDRRTAPVRSFFGRAQQVTSTNRASGAGGLHQGRRVRHATLGSGVVLEVEGSGDATKVVVFFERAGKRKLVARVAKLELL